MCVCLASRVAAPRRPSTAWAAKPSSMSSLAKVDILPSVHTHTLTPCQQGALSRPFLRLAPMCGDCCCQRPFGPKSRNGATTSGALQCPSALSSGAASASQL